MRKRDKREGFEATPIYPDHRVLENNILACECLIEQGWGSIVVRLISPEGISLMPIEMLNRGPDKRNNDMLARLYEAMEAQVDAAKVIGRLSPEDTTSSGLTGLHSTLIRIPTSRGIHFLENYTHHDDGNTYMVTVHIDKPA